MDCWAMMMSDNFCNFFFYRFQFPSPVFVLDEDNLDIEVSHLHANISVNLVTA